MLKHRPAYIQSISTMIVLLLLVACTSSEDDMETSMPMPTYPPTSIEVLPTNSPDPPPPTIAPPTITMSPVTPTAFPIPDPTPAFPGADETTFPIAEIFFSGFSPECEFPCWYGLRIGESSQEDVQRLFDDVFGFDGAIDFWAPHKEVVVNIPPIASSARSIEGLRGTGYDWAANGGSVTVAAYLDEETENLYGLTINWSQLLYTDFTLQRMFEEFGTPSSIWVGFTMSQSVSGLVILYNNGVIFHSYIYPGVVTTPQGTFLEYCLSNKRILVDAQSGHIIITSPIGNRLDEYSPFKKIYLWGKVQQHSLQPVEEITDTTTESLVQAVLAGEDACVYVYVPPMDEPIE